MRLRDVAIQVGALEMVNLPEAIVSAARERGVDDKKIFDFEKNIKKDKEAKALAKKAQDLIGLAMGNMQIQGRNALFHLFISAG